MRAAMPTSLLLSALVAVSLTGCAAGPGGRSAPGAGTRTAAAAATAAPLGGSCAGARYRFGRPVTVHRLVSVSAALPLAAGQTGTFHEHGVGSLHSTASSTAGEADAAAAYRAYAARAWDRDGTLLIRYNQYLPVRDDGPMTPSGAGRFVSAHVGRLTTVRFTRSCAHGAPASGTVTAWYAVAGGVGLRCGYTRHLPALMLQALRLACDQG